MTVDSLKVDAATSRTCAGAVYVPRRNTVTGEIHWCYVPRLRPGVDHAQYICGAAFNVRPSGAPNQILTDELEGGTPCPECDARWSMT